MTSSPELQHEHSHGPSLSRLLELDAEIHHGILEEATEFVAELSQGGKKRLRILDVGAGTGAGTIALARRFPSSEVVAVDVDNQMLAQVRSRARSLGLAHRVTTIAADIAGATPPLESADVVWSSAMLHEVADPDRAFRNLFEAILPGGLLVVIEMDASPWVLPAAYRRFEDRVRTGGGASTGSTHPNWATAIETAGFTMETTRQLVTDRMVPADGPAGEYAALELRRHGHAALPRLQEPDRAALMTLTGDGEGNVRELGDLWIRGTRTLWAARRP